VAPAITIDTSDNLGIGKTTPGYKVDVNGTVNASAFRGDGSQLTNLPGGGGSTALDKVTANTTILGTNHAETNLYSFAVPGGTLSTSNMLRLTIQISDLDIVDGDNFVLRFKYGTTTVLSMTISNDTQNSFTNGKGLVSFIIAGDGSTSSQIGTARFHTTLFAPGSIAQGTSAIDSTVTQTLAVSVDWANWTGSFDGITLGHAILEKIS
jgi:hypothetical protein